jgi:hypothetical protein
VRHLGLSERTKVAIAWTAVPTLRQLATPSEFLERHNIHQIDEVQAKAMIGHKASGVFIAYPGLSSSEAELEEARNAQVAVHQCINDKPTQMVERCNVEVDLRLI